MNRPTGAQRIRDMLDYILEVRNLTHVAVLRRSGHLKYFHHYLVVEVGLDFVNIVHYTSGTYASKALSVARIDYQTIRFHDHGDSDLLDFTSGVYFVTRQEYPSTDHGMRLAYRRAGCRLGEAEYSASSNNCESFVTWVLTGEAKCEQFEKSKRGKRILMDAIDSGIDQCKQFRNGLSDLPTRLYAISLSHSITKSGHKLLNIAVIREIIKDLGLSTPASAALAAKNAATTVAKVRPSAVTAGVSTGITAAVAIPVEAVFCGLEIHQLHSQKKFGMISEENFKRQVTKKVSGSASSVAVATGTGFLGTFIGQIVCPIPVIGGAIGGAVGSIVGSIAGRVTGSVVSGKIFDAISGKADDEHT